MRCPFCKADNDRVIDSRASDEGASIRRRRECLICKRRFTTYERVEEMVSAGAAEEVRRATNASPTARKALGFEELLSGDVEAMKRNTRRYAKRQLTWMRKLPGVETIDMTARRADDVADELLGPGGP